MKARFSTLDIIAIVPELKNKICTGWRVNQVYDCDYKTYLFKLNKSIVQMKKDEDPVNVDEETSNKMTLIIESGLRIHTTDYDWPKSHAPGNFATRLRKHLRNKRIEDIRQVGVDRLIDIQFGSNQAANHLLIELYDRGNLILTDANYCILSILRWRKPLVQGKPSAGQLDEVPEEQDNIKVGQVFSFERCRKLENLEVMNEEKISEILHSSAIIQESQQSYKKRNKPKPITYNGTIDVNLKNLFNPFVIYGSSLLEDKLLKSLAPHLKKNPTKCTISLPIDANKRIDREKVEFYVPFIKAALDEADVVLREVKEKSHSQGYIIQKQTVSNIANDSSNNTNKKDSKECKKPEIVFTNIDFFPIESCARRRIEQEPILVIQEYDSFDKTVDVYYSNLESQKIDSHAFNAEKEVMKKLENLKMSQNKRLEDLGKVQKEDEEKGRLVEMNCDKIEQALLIIRSMIANQMSWSDIWRVIQEAKAMEDPIASLIVGVKFDRNEFTMKLSDPYNSQEETRQEEKPTGKSKNKKQQQSNQNFKLVDIDISLSAYANARRFFDKRRTAVNKEKKTIEVSKKAFKNVERRTKEMLKEVVVKTNITKARKRYWFENFFWFITSEGYLVVAGRDAEQNELLVKRYMKKNDIYVHADLHGASTVIVKNEFAKPVPPKTLVEAGTMAVCYSSAWDSKIACTSWWVYPHQVSKTAPAGEYLTLGAFIIRGKKNFLPLSNLILGFGFLFRLDEESIERRKATREARELTMQSREMKDESQKEVVDGDEIETVESDGDEPEDPDSDSSSEKDLPSALVAKSQVGDGENGEDEEESVGDTDKKGDDNEEEEEDYDEELEEDNRNVENRLIDTLTENPLPDDILLYAIPMCGPYSAFQSFKYKVKVVTGAAKRGKAAKTCLGLFMHDKRATQREKDLLRALKEQDFARNLPNKVKVSAPAMKTITKRKPKKSQVMLPI